VFDLPNRRERINRDRFGVIFVLETLEHIGSTDDIADSRMRPCASCWHRAASATVVTGTCVSRSQRASLRRRRCSGNVDALEPR
jgi:hypothetical protein